MKYLILGQVTNALIYILKIILGKMDYVRRDSIRGGFCRGTISKTPLKGFVLKTMSLSIPASNLQFMKHYLGRNAFIFTGLHIVYVSPYLTECKSSWYGFPYMSYVHYISHITTGKYCRCLNYNQQFYSQRKQIIIIFMVRKCQTI